MCGKLVVFDISENGRQIGEKLSLLLSPEQQEELEKFILERKNSKSDTADFSYASSYQINIQKDIMKPLTEILQGDLYLCPEERSVKVRGIEVSLTAKEFDILALLITNPKRVFTYEMIMDLVWHEDYTYYSRKAINNHISNLRKKLKISPDSQDYIKNVTGVGYKFDIM